jgi:O-antigen/teichoic acid export membrane protein
VIAAQLQRLAGQSAIYGLGGIVSRVVAIFLLPLYTAYLDPADLGRVSVLLALNAVLVTILRGGVQSAFFRFYFDATDAAARRRTVRTAFWFTMASATVGLVAGWLLATPIANALSLEGDEWLVRAQFVFLWAQMNYEQLTALFRVEQRPKAFVAASLTNVVITIGATIVLVVGLDQGALGVIVGGFTGTLAVYVPLLAYRREQLGLEFDTRLFHAMERFGLPLVPSALALIALNFSDRFFITHLASLEETGQYELGARIAGVMVLLLTAFRNAWPAFAYSISDDREARRTYGFVLTYLMTLNAWMATTLALLAPWLVQILAPTNRGFWAGERVVAPLAFGATLFAGYVVVAIGVGRARRTAFNWVVTGFAAVVNIALNAVLVPRYGMEGAAAAAVTSLAILFVGMAWWSQRVYPVPYQWRRVATSLAAGVALVVVGKALDVPLPLALALSVAYPFALLLLGFSLPQERNRLLRGLPARRRSSAAPPPTQ